MQHSLSRRSALVRLGAGVVGTTMAAGNLTASAQEETSPLASLNVSLSQAQAAIDAAIAESEARGVLMNIVILDAGANLTAFARMDGRGWVVSISPSRKREPPFSSRCRAVRSVHSYSRENLSTVLKFPTRA